MQNNVQIGEAVLFLKKNISEIYTVSEWAETQGYTRSHFSLLIVEKFNQSPYAIIKQEKYKKVKQLVRVNPDGKGRTIANDAGFKNVKSLYKFLRYHFETSLTELRKQVKKGGYS